MLQPKVSLSRTHPAPAVLLLEPLGFYVTTCIYRKLGAERATRNYTTWSTRKPVAQQRQATDFGEVARGCLKPFRRERIRSLARPRSNLPITLYNLQFISLNDLLAFRDFYPPPPS